MPPKTKEAPKKSTPTIIRQAISSSSLVYVPENVLEGRNIQYFNLSLQNLNRVSVFFVMYHVYGCHVWPVNS